jgi:immune inhibitor A
MILRLRVQVVLCLLLLLLISSAQAETPTLHEDTDAAYPTAQALQTTDIPALDRVALARRFLGLTNLPPQPPARTQPLPVGTVDDFRIVNSATNQAQVIQAQLLAVGDHIYAWVQMGQGVTRNNAQQFVQGFDAQVYDVVRGLWGSEPTPGIDGDPRIYALFTTGINPGTAAYFSSQHIYPRAVVPLSNEHEMLILNLEAVGYNIATPYVISTAAHEFQHMIRHHQDINEAGWLDEGLSMFTERYLNLDDVLWAANPFANAPLTQLNRWPLSGGLAAHYGASMLFVDYFYVRYGLDALQRLSSEAADDLRGVDAVLRSMGEPGVDAFFADWVLANALRQPNGIYGYNGRWPDVPSARPLAYVYAYPYRADNWLRQYASDVYVLDNFRDAQNLHISLSAPDDVALLDLPAPSADASEWFMVSSRGDDSHTRMTRSFDLSAVDSATLQYDLWYDIETYWDYAYVTISSDGGKTWQLLDAAYTTTEDPHGRAYGAGYTGRSDVHERDRWLTERISLDAYVGQQVMIGFEMLTDDAVTQPGMALDNIRIDAIGYRQDFEQGYDDWRLAGWLRTDNRLPQRVWVQVAQQVATGDDLITRWLLEPGENSGNHDDEDDAHTWPLALAPHVQQVTLVIAPFAPVTTQPTRYALSIVTD